MREPARETVRASSRGREPAAHRVHPPLPTPKLADCARQRLVDRHRVAGLHVQSHAATARSAAAHCALSPCQPDYCCSGLTVLICAASCIPAKPAPAWSGSQPAWVRPPSLEPSPRWPAPRTPLYGKTPVD